MKIDLNMEELLEEWMKKKICLDAEECVYLANIIVSRCRREYAFEVLTSLVNKERDRRK